MLQKPKSLFRADALARLNNKVENSMTLLQLLLAVAIPRTQIVSALCSFYDFRWLGFDFEVAFPLGWLAN